MARIVTDANDPEFRAELRKIGAPEWFPQDAPRHITDGTSEQKDDGTWLTKFVCSICGWEKHFLSGDEGTMHTIAIGDRWALHSGSIGGISISGIDINKSDPRLEPFEKYLDDKKVE